VGDTQYLGDRVELANVVDGAWISFYVPALVAALAAAAFAASYDVPFDVGRTAISTALPVIGSFLTESGRRLRADDLESENPVRLYERALETVIAAAENQGLLCAMPRAAMQVLRELPTEDHGADLAVLVRRLMLRQSDGQPTP
jgi:3-hydroxyisobutyrate dehydrogenase-like beta-hydroxyacid dehydrogenase